MQPIPMLQVEGVVLEQVHPQHRAARALEVVEPERSVAEVLAVRVTLFVHMRCTCGAHPVHIRCACRQTCSTVQCIQPKRAHNTPRGIRCLSLTLTTHRVVSEV
eukprot:scaffold42807_cov62-Phaeocystis_antarctica.AAC.1